jgi:hypothetical protein
MEKRKISCHCQENNGYRTGHNHISRLTQGHTVTKETDMPAFPKWSIRTGINIKSSESNHSGKYSGAFSQIGFIVSEDGKGTFERNICVLCFLRRLLETFSASVNIWRLRLAANAWTHEDLHVELQSLLSAFNQTWTVSTILYYYIPRYTKFRESPFTGSRTRINSSATEIIKGAFLPLRIHQHFGSVKMKDRRLCSAVSKGT